MLKLVAFGAILARIAGGAELPFTIITEDVTSRFPNSPRIQSFAFAQWKGKWVFVGGRSAGYHGVGGGDAEFLRAHANREIWVIDTTATPARTYHVSLDTLPPSHGVAKHQLSSTAQLSYQDGDKLYIAGGYGQDQDGKWVTFPVLSVIDLPPMIQGVMEGNIPAQHIKFVETPLVQSTGGEMIKLTDGMFYVAMGHVFSGSYTAFQGQQEKNTPAVSQVYLNEIRKLKISLAGNTPTVSLVETIRDEKEFHRRDLNVVRTISPGGVGLAAFGGVFTPDTQLAYTSPVYWWPGSKHLIDAAFVQRMNAYACATMLMYDSAAATMYTTFFGGISRYFWKDDKTEFVANPMVGTKTDAVYLDGMQWSDQISTVRRSYASTTGSTDEFVQRAPLPSFVGSDSVFIPDSQLPRVAGQPDILETAAIVKGKTPVGYIYGGIRASPFRFPYSRSSTPYNSGAVPTKPNDIVLRVYVEPRTAILPSQ